MATPPAPRYLLDTCILIHYARGNELAKYIEKQYQFQNTTTPPLLCEVTVGELYAFALLQNWGERKRKELQRLIDYCVVVPLSLTGIHHAYAEIDAFSQKPGSGLSARNMGKNDIWIAATAHVAKAKLLTTDGDFHHLDTKWIDLHYIGPTAAE